MNTKALATLLFTVAVLSADAALACGGGHSAGHPYSISHTYVNHSYARRKTLLARAVPKNEVQSRVPAPANAATDPPPVAPSLAAGLADSTF
jgi:hypothetical protein